ncbi:MAG: hypothetical protein LC737_00485, partial [Chloroflexi bacterium]|nr:hypothetical protein [Chloroflexota bacterium]
VRSMSVTLNAEAGLTHDEIAMASLWQQVRDLLEGEQRRIVDEIQRYPPPIPRCDAQFNFLLEGHASIAQALNRLRATRAESLPREQARRVLHEFFASIDTLDQAARECCCAALLP